MTAVMMKRVAALLCATALAGCAVGPDYKAPQSLPGPATQLNALDANRGATADAVQDQWWQLFDDPVLNRLVEKGLHYNTDLRIASANLQRARALLSEAGAARLPTTEVNGQGTRRRQRDPRTNNQQTTNYYAVGFDASYEIDLFGGVSRSIEAARGDREAAQAALDAARVSVAAEIARTYVVACGYGAQAEVARETVRLQSQSFDLQKRLMEGGRSTQRDVDQATVLVEQARAQIATFEAERRAALYALAVLVGDTPANVDPQAEMCRTLPLLAQPIPVGDGEALLARRPDVRQAERRLAADTARIGVATAALFPRISLLGNLLSSAPRAADIGTDGSFGWSLGPLISWTFPFSGAARARVRENKAIAEGSLASFDAAVLGALQETQQALARLAGALDREQALSRADAASQNAAQLSRRRFDFGADSFLQLIDAQRTAADTRAALAQAQADRAEAQISLFKSLGGGWAAAPEPTRSPVMTGDSPQ